jgi:hypothetical protein
LAHELFESNLSDVPRVGFYISYHQITSTLTVSGLGLLTIAFVDSLQATRYLAIFIDLITLGNIVVFTIITMRKHPDLIRQSVPQRARDLNYGEARIKSSIMLLVLGVFQHIFPLHCKGTQIRRCT